jgi:hypothetical protein
MVFGNATADQVTTGAVTSATTFVTPTDSYAFFVTNGNAAYQYTYSTNTWSTVSASIPDGRYLGVTPVSQRLVVSGNPSAQGRVYFSDPAAPTTFAADNYVDIGNSSGVQVAWGDALFVSGNSYWAVFYGESTDATGNPIFNYRTAETPANIRSACAAPDGVYYSTTEGIYRTTGGQSVKVSGPLDDWFMGRTESSFTGRAHRQTTSSDRLTASSDRLYFAHGGNLVSQWSVWVMELSTGEWTYWELPTKNFAAGRRDPAEPYSLFFFGDEQSNVAEVFRLPEYDNDNLTTDDGAAIASHYTSGRLGVADGQQADVRDFDVYGSGTVTLALAADGGSINSTANGDGTVGGAISTALATGLNAVNTGALCRDLSFNLSATSGQWQVDRLAARVRGVRDWT